MKTTKEQSEIATARLRKLLKPGKEVFTIVKHMAKSGMSREIAVFICKGGEILNISWEVSHLLGWKRSDKTGAIKVSGCGMDMGFHLVYSMGRRLFPEGFKLAKGQHGRNGDKSGFDTDGGYALQQRWL